jgi:hypothetical protein
MVEDFAPQGIEPSSGNVARDGDSQILSARPIGGGEDEQAVHALLLVVAALASSRHAR